MQTTSKVFMVKPVRFGINAQTAQDSSFQKTGADVQKNALREFMSFLSLLKANGITVVVVEDTFLPHTPDSIFPDNWFSTHSDGTLVIYPMAVQNRRMERKSEFIDVIRQNFGVRRVVDLTHWEEEGLFLEGTGSMVLDRDARVVYVCRSPRTSEAVSADFCRQMGYTRVVFDAVGADGSPVRHTDMMMSVGSEYAFVCLEAICLPGDREAVVSSLTRAGKTIVEITLAQMSDFMGNVLELRNPAGRKLFVMSGAARKSLTLEQARLLNASGRILSPELDTIEKIGGGSAGCMMAEIF